MKEYHTGQKSFIAGETVKIKKDILVGFTKIIDKGTEFIIEDFVLNVFGNKCKENFIGDVHKYYGKINGLGHVIDASDIDFTDAYMKKCTRENIFKISQGRRPEIIKISKKINFNDMSDYKSVEPTYKILSLKYGAIDIFLLDGYNILVDTINEITKMVKQQNGQKLELSYKFHEYEPYLNLRFDYYV